MHVRVMVCVQYPTSTVVPVLRAIYTAALVLPAMLVGCSSDDSGSNPFNETPGCPGSMVDCGLGCVDLTSSPSNCGACGAACLATEVCSLGQCANTCSPGQTNCSGACVDTLSSFEHCGTCFAPCQYGQVCSNGICIQDPVSSGGTPGVGGGTSGGTIVTGGTVPIGGASGGTGGVATGGVSTGGVATGGNPSGGNPGCDATGFYVEGQSIYDVNCNEFIPRGVNFPYAWFATGAQGRFGDMASVGTNAVRVVLATGDQWTRTTGSEVSSIIAWAKANEMVAILEVHDSTGYGDPDAGVHPDAAVSYWSSNEILSAIQGEEAYVMINIANEPFGNNASNQWESFHVGAVASLRSAGLHHLLIVDAPNWGQDWENTMRSGNGATNIFNADPDSNVVFSVHMYDVYSDASTVNSYFSNFLSKGLPLIVGEFAADHGNRGNVDEATIMANAESYGVGYLGWSWSGNSGDLASLDITSNFNVSSLTTWGNRLINGTNGISSTADTCTCFD